MWLKTREFNEDCFETRLLNFVSSQSHKSTDARVHLQLLEGPHGGRQQTSRDILHFNFISSTHTYVLNNVTRSRANKYAVC